MKNDNFEVGIVKYVCPICGKEVDNNIIINNKFIKKAAQNIKEMNGKFIGYSKNACKECLKYKDEVVFFIGIIPEKSDKTMGVYRTGHISGVKQESDFVKDIPAKYILKTANDVKFCFIDVKAGKEIGIFNND